MTGQISSLSIELVAAVVAASMLIGAIDIIRQPGWAWKRVEESKPAYLILVLILPVIGLAMYVLRARPKVTAAVAGTTAIDGALIDAAVVDPAVAGTGTVVADDPGSPLAGAPDVSGTQPAAPGVPGFARGDDRFTGFREVADSGHPGPWETEPGQDEADAFEVSGTFFSTGASSRSVRHPIALARGYRPKQRTSLADEHDESEIAEGPAPVPVPQAFAPEPDPVAAALAVPAVTTAVAQTTATTTAAAPAAAPSVPSGWKVDPTGRHQFRYWDGFHWTENVADNGDESRDAVVSA